MWNNRRTRPRRGARDTAEAAPANPRAAVVEEPLVEEQDLDSRKALEALRLSEEKYRAIVELSPLWIVELDPSAAILHFNRQAAQESGYSPEELRGHSVFELMPEEDRLRQIELFQRGLTGSHNAVETRLRMKDGALRTFLNNSAIIRTPGAVRLVVFAVDVTARAATEAALVQQMRIESTASRISNLLARAENLPASFEPALGVLGEAMDACRAYIYLMDREAHNAAKAYEWSSPRAPSRFPLGSVVSEADVPEWTKALLAGEPLAIGDACDLPTETPVARHLFLHDGTRASLVVPMILRGEIYGFLAVDETRRSRTWADTDVRMLRLTAEILSSFLMRLRAEESERAAREAAESADRAKTVFLASMSHEIRTPMSGILGMIELALETELSPEQKEYLALAKSSAESLLGLLGGILDLAKIEAGKLDLETRPFSLRALVEETLGALSLRAQEKGLEVGLRVDPLLPGPLLGDPARLREVLANLIDNAVKYTEKGEVAVRADLLERSADSVSVRFAVRDTGVGIPESQQAQIFDFYTRGVVPARRYAGAGIGLSICRQVVGILGGRIEVESRPGEGSTFRFDLRFPLAPGAREDRPDLDLRGRRALVADPWGAGREPLRETLAAWGFEASEAASEEEAVTLARRALAAGRPFDLILLDAGLPPDGGHAAAKKLKAAAVLSERIVLMLTGPQRKKESRPWESRHVHLRLLKPIRQSALEDAVRVVLGMPAGADRAGAPGAAELPGVFKVLLVEDNPVNRKLLSTLLEKRGWAVTQSVDGHGALEAFRREPYDAVLMDIQMPGMDGFEATRAIRAEEEGRSGHTPIVAMTAHAMKGDREMCLEAGMDEYVSKPFHVADVIRIVDNLARSSRTRAAAPPKEPPAIDAEDVRRRLGVEVPVILEMLDLLLHDAPAQGEAMEQAWASAAWSALASGAHRLKGGSGNLGATSVFRACRELETSARKGDREASRTHLDAVKRELGRLAREVEDLKKKGRGGTGETAR